MGCEDEIYRPEIEECADCRKHKCDEHFYICAFCKYVVCDDCVSFSSHTMEATCKYCLLFKASQCPSHDTCELCRKGFKPEWNPPI